MQFCSIGGDIVVVMVVGVLVVVTVVRYCGVVFVVVAVTHVKIN